MILLSEKEEISIWKMSGKVKIESISQEKGSDLQNYLDDFNKEIGDAGGLVGEDDYVVEGTEPEEEYNYVVIVQEGQEAEDANKDEFEFEDDEKKEEVHLAYVKAEKVGKKTQSATSGSHMCSYCNYTTPKRYLLARHMKSHSDDR